MRLLTSILFTFSTLISYTQKQGNIWYFGDHAGLDFNTTPPSYLSDGQTDFHPPNLWNEGCSSISDSSGTLLFYSNGEKIWNRYHQTMLNGDSLLGHSSAASGCIILPRPGSDRYFYVLTTDALENLFANGIRYSVIDMCLDNGNGAVLSNEKNILVYDNTTEKLSAVKHANGVDYWIVSHELNSNSFLSFNLTNNGLLDTVISSIGVIDPQGWGGL